MTGDFDLNIERVLEGWSIGHAIREFIANALDERVLSASAHVQVSRLSEGRWSVRDFGRGLHYTHLTQNENNEKHEREADVIGRFGVGLKDALAVLNRRGVTVQIRSRHCDIQLVSRPKAEFSDVKTLHARVSAPSNEAMLGTEVLLGGVSDVDVEAAKSFFLEFSSEHVLEATRFGSVIRREPGRPARVYVKGLVVAEEANFAFSYNITSLTEQMRRALNRERTNVGRGAYSERVKAILLACQSAEVARILADDLGRIAQGTSRDEVRTWSDVGLRAAQILNARGGVLFVTASELLANGHMVDIAVRDGRQIVAVPDSIREKLDSLSDVEGNPIQSIERFTHDWNESFDFDFVEPSDLTARERDVLDSWPVLAGYVGGLPAVVREVCISSTMRTALADGCDADGLWLLDKKQIVVRRGVLASRERFAAVFLHELAHAKSGEGDVSREFEVALTDIIGMLGAHLLAARSQSGGGFNRTGTLSGVHPKEPNEVPEGDSPSVQPASSQVFADLIATLKRVDDKEGFQRLMSHFGDVTGVDFAVSLRPDLLIAFFRDVQVLAEAEVAMGRRLMRGASVSMEWPPVLAPIFLRTLSAGIAEKAEGQSAPIRRALGSLRAQVDLLAESPAQLVDAAAFRPASGLVAEFYDALTE